MKDAQGSTPGGRTHWKRFAVVTIPAAVAAGGLTVMMATGALAASIAVSGEMITVQADSLEANGVAVATGVDRAPDGKLHPVAIAGIKQASINNLCLATTIPLGVPGFEKIGLVIKAGANSPVEGSNMFLDAGELLGENAVFSNAEIGRDAADLPKGPVIRDVTPGTFGVQADKLTVQGLKVKALSITAGTLKLSGLRLAVQAGEATC